MRYGGAGGGPDEGTMQGAPHLSRTSPPYTPTLERRDLLSLGGTERWKEAGEER